MAEIFDWPVALRPASVEWGLFVPQAAGRSTFDGSVQAQTIAAPRWFFSIDTGRLQRLEVPAWEALMDGLRGQVNRVRCWDWRREAPLGVATGAPVLAATATGASAATAGWTPSVAGILLRGSYAGINGELKRVRLDLSSDSAGEGMLFFEPPLRAPAPASTPLLLVKPTATFVRVEPRHSMTQQGAASLGTSYSFMEDWTP